MTKYIFHGGGTRKDSSNNDTFYAEFVKDIPDNGVLLLVYFASRTDDNSERIAYDTQKCEEFSNGKKFDIQVATMSDFIAQVSEADAIYFRGGSTEKLLNTLKQFPYLKPYFENKHKTVAGSSAGAYVLSTLYSSHYEDVAAPGLGIVPVRVITHYKSEKMPPKEGAVKALGETRQELQLITLEEGEWQSVNQ
ncbi:MAG TPA: Type 1 glutamine amidotransferase-like domain-containing protein [Candidatus Paceibacterota bacterium]